jgi:hypothetical protein
MMNWKNWGNAGVIAAPAPATGAPTASAPMTAATVVNRFRRDMLRFLPS